MSCFVLFYLPNVHFCVCVCFCMCFVSFLFVYFNSVPSKLPLSPSGTAVQCSKDGVTLRASPRPNPCSPSYLFVTQPVSPQGKALQWEPFLFSLRTLCRSLHIPAFLSSCDILPEYSLSFPRLPRFNPIHHLLSWNSPCST